MSATMAEVGVERPRFARKEMANLLAFIHSRTGTKTPDERFLLPGSSLSGQRLFSEKGCVACHSVYGAGGRIGPDLSSKEYSRSVADIAAAMWNHDTLMWLKAGEAKTPRPTFGQGELADIIAFLYSIRSADVPGDASIGKKLFAEKGCAECHESVVLDLSSSDPPGFPAKLAAAMWNHIPTAGRLIRDKNLRWPRFESDEVRDLAAYLTEQPGR
jgi:cytochrome c2